MKNSNIQEALHTKINKNLKKSKWSFNLNNTQKYEHLNINTNFLFNMKYSKDSLLKSRKLVLKNNALNLYSALVKTEDFEKKRPLNSLPYLTGKIVKKITPLVSEEVIKDLEYYMQQKLLKRTVNFGLVIT